MSIKTQLYLASTSPRRHQLLSELGVNFEAIAAPVDESRNVGEVVENYVQRLSREKAMAGLQHRDYQRPLPVMGADTIVVLDGDCLGKPRNSEQAASMLGRLSGRTHQVYTAVTCLDASREYSILTVTRIQFGALSKTQIDAYLNSGEPFDKAGAYAIQGLAGQFIRSLEGSYTGVVGLPLYETTQLLDKFDIKTQLSI